MIRRYADRVLDRLIAQTSARADICDGWCVHLQCESGGCSNSGREVYRCQLPNCTRYTRYVCSNNC